MKIPLVFRLLLVVACAACVAPRDPGGGAERAESRSDLVSSANPERIVVAPLAGVPLGLAAKVWEAAAGAAAKAGFRIVGDASAVAQFQAVGRGTRTLAADAPTAVRLRSALHARLERDCGAQGVLYLAFVHRPASVRNGVAMWDGATERVLAIEEDLHDSARGYRGVVDAWSLRVWIEDADARLVAEGFAGLSINARMRAGRWEAIGGPPRLGAPGALPAAIRTALDELRRDLRSGA